MRKLQFLCGYTVFENHGALKLEKIGKYDEISLKSISCRYEDTKRFKLFY